MLLRLPVVIENEDGPVGGSRLGLLGSYWRSLNMPKRNSLTALEPTIVVNPDLMVRSKTVVFALFPPRRPSSVRSGSGCRWGSGSQIVDLHVEAVPVVDLVVDLAEEQVNVDLFAVTTAARRAFPKTRSANYIERRWRGPRRSCRRIRRPDRWRPSAGRPY